MNPTQCMQQTSTLQFKSKQSIFHAELQTAEEQPSFLVSAADAIRQLMHEVGMAHVPVHVAEAYAFEVDDDLPPELIPKTGASILASLYQKVPPSGVTLIVESCMSSVTSFVESSPKEFRDKTRSVILLGGALLPDAADPDGFLQPDPLAQSNSLDMEASKRFFRIAQENLVPLIVISRLFSRQVKVPALLFDALANHGGKVGEKILSVQKGGLKLLWEAANADPSDIKLRRGLPSRCCPQWFCETFCKDGKMPQALIDRTPTPEFERSTLTDFERRETATSDFDAIWSAVDHLTVYAPLALMASLPSLMSRVARGTDVYVRGVRHTLFGTAPSVANDKKPTNEFPREPSKTPEGTSLTDTNILKTVLYQSLFMGVRFNMSNFSLLQPPPIPITGSGSTKDYWQFNPHYKALDWLLPSPSHAVDHARLRSGTLGTP